jgi:hypothetical protein
MEGKCSWIVREKIAEGIIADGEGCGEQRKFGMCHPERSEGSPQLFGNLADKKLRRSFASLRMTAG